MGSVARDLDALNPKSDSALQTRLGVVVRVCRQNLGITQEELAWRANLHRSYIADIERGARNTTLRTLANLAEALEVTLENLISRAAVPDGPGPRINDKRVPQVTGEILLVEDSQADAALTVRSFKRAKLTNPIRIVHDGEEAMDYLLGTGRYEERRRARPELILLDLNLPRMSGLELLRRMKENGVTSAIPVVVLTASRNDHIVIECERLGAENYIVKPLGIESLVRLAPKLNLNLTLGSPPTTKNTVEAA